MRDDAHNTYMNTTTSPTTHTTSPIEAVAASGTGAIAGFESRCTCGLVIRSSMESIIRQDVWEHVEWHRKRGR